MRMLQEELGGYDATALHEAGAVAETAVAFTPVGTFNAAYTTATGNNAISPDIQVSHGERLQAGAATAAAALPILAGVRIASKEFTAFESFDAFKGAFGSAGEGRVWHHIVEQRTANIDKFGAEAIHNTENVVNVTAEVNQTIANYY